MNDEELRAMTELELEIIDQWFSRIGLIGSDEKVTEAIDILISSHNAAIVPDWSTLSIDWANFAADPCEPFVDEEWMRYDPSEGF